MQQYLKSLYDVHSWLGLGLGLVLYVVCFSGVVALYLDELGAWQRGDAVTGQSVDPFALDDVVQGVIRERINPGAHSEDLFLSLLLPGAYQPLLQITVRTPDETLGDIWHVDLATGQTVVRQPNHLIHWMERLHTDLLLPSPFGRYLLGLVGGVMLVSIVTGTLLHRKRWQELFTFRPGRSLRVRWGDLHKLIGIWGLPFHFVVSLTGSILGFTGLILIPAALVAFEGDVEAAMAEMSDNPAGETRALSEMLPLDGYLSEARRAIPGLVPRRVQFVFHENGLSRVSVLGDLPDALVYLPSVTFDGAGRKLRVSNWSAEGPVRQIYAMIVPLHYAFFGGLTTKLLYAAMGAGLCFIIYSGITIWLARPVPVGRERLTGGLRRGLVSVVFGLHTAVGISFLVECVFWDKVPLSQSGVFWLFLCTWACVAILPWLMDPRRAAFYLSALLALALVLLPLAAGRAFGFDTINGAPVAPLFAWVIDLTFLGIALSIGVWSVSNLRRARGTGR